MQRNRILSSGALIIMHTSRYMTARLLGDKDLHIIRAYDKRPPAVQEEQLEEVCAPPLPLLPRAVPKADRAMHTDSTDG